MRALILHVEAYGDTLRVSAMEIGEHQASRPVSGFRPCRRDANARFDSFFRRATNAGEPEGRPVRS